MRICLSLFLGISSTNFDLSNGDVGDAGGAVGVGAGEGEDFVELFAKGGGKGRDGIAEAAVNEVISRHLDVTIEFMSREQTADIVDLSKLPEDASETLRIVRVGDYDACACIGAHVKNTAEIGTFKILSHDYEDGRWRVRWKVQ